MIRIATLDEFDPAVLKALANALYAAFGVGAEATDHLSAPEGLAEPLAPHDLLRALPAVEAFADDRVLFLTRRELATRALESGPAPTNGLAEYHGQRCVVTVAGMGDVRPDAIRTLARYAMHELGHTFGLHHCLDPRCAMYPHWTRSFASGEASFCTYCREKSEQRVRQGKS